MNHFSDIICLSDIIHLCLFATALLLLWAACSRPAKAKLVEDPSDGYSMPAVFKPRDFTSLSRIFLQPAHSYWRAENFKLAEFTRVSYKGDEWVRWHFIKKAVATYIPSIAYRYPSRIATTGYSLRVLNRGPQAVIVSGWGDNEPKNFITLEPGMEKLVHITGMTSLVAQATKPDVEYDLYLRDLSIFYPEAEGITTEKFEISRQLVAGRKMIIKLAAQGVFDKKVIDVEVRKEHWVVWRIRLTPEELRQLSTRQQCTIEREVPWYLSSGKVNASLVADGLRAKGVEAQAEVVNRRRAQLPVMERRQLNGRPTFMLDGKPFTWNGYATYNFYPGAINEFAANEANLFHITCAPGRHYHNVAAPTWLGGNEYDFGEIEQMATTILQANPKARIMMRLALGLPPFWYNEHKDSLVRTQSTDGKEVVWFETDSQVGSLTSEDWRKQQAIALRKLVQYLASRPWASQVIGFNIGGAMTEEWFAWATCDEIIKPVKYFGDYSHDNQQAFRKWCAAKGYPYTRVPDAKLRNKLGYDLFPDDTNGRWVMAYNAFMNEVSADTVKYFAAVIKEETKRRSLVGVFYGYVVLLAGEARQSDSGQFGVRELLESEDVDYLGGVPQHYLRRLVGDGYAQNATAVASVVAHNKQYMDDNDLFSWLHEGIWHTPYDEKDPRGALIKMHRRWLATEVIYGNAYEWFSLDPKWHHDEGVMDEFALEARIHTESLKEDRTPIEEVAFVIDDHTFLSLTPSASTHFSNQVLLGAVGRTGASMGVWLLSDVDRLPERIKFVVVVNATAPRADDLEKLRTLIARGGRTIMVVGLPGLIDAQSLRWKPANVERLLGLPIRLDDEAQPARAGIIETNEWLCPIMAPMNDAEPKLIRPRPYLAGEGFMHYEDGKTAGVERDLPTGGKLIWCGVPPYAGDEWLRKQVIAAGVHCYAPATCSIHATKELVSVTSVYVDDRDIELKWPENVMVTDLFDGWHGEGTTMSCPFTHGQTRLFRVQKK